LLLRWTAGADLQAAAGESEGAVLGVQTFFDRNFGLIGLVYLQANASLGSDVWGVGMLE
jgi:hypothetical protein